MILKALYDYYQKKQDVLPAFGKELKEIGFLLVITRDGEFLRFEDRRIDSKSASSFLVKKHVGRSSGVAPNYLYDNSSYVFCYSNKGDLESCRKYFDAFKAKIEEIFLRHPENQGIKAIHKFYTKSPEEILARLQQDPLWEEIVKNLNKKYSTFSFLLEGDTKIIAEQDELLDLMTTSDRTDERICLISGEKGACIETTTATMIPGSQATAKLVAFQVNSGYDSYGKEKCGNAPISEISEFAYTTALNHLLAVDSRNKFLIGNRTFLFWSSSTCDVGKQMEEGLFTLFGFKDDSTDPDHGIEKVKKVFTSVYSGLLPISKDDRFFILGLAPNIARISVVYWSELPLKEFAAILLRHFDDMDIVDSRKDRKPYIGLHAMLSAVTLGGKSSEVTPNLPDAVARSIFQGLPYPDTLFAECIRRIRAEQNVYVTRAAIIKAYLNRKFNNIKPITSMLDKENTNQGYLCGRLFATLVKIQEAGSGIDSIRERFMNAASATPSAVFSTLMNLSIHQQDKLNKGQQVFYEKLISEILSKFDANGFPAHLNLQDQGRFFVGYYHQRQDFFTKQENNNE
ncbi:MAG: type I-C CRISPR-associated protein Cas8c/Csd1 [Bacteroidales bacterium]|jgi:CRISPR-associated protein Csd1|nr:type I-C CRISPR-associated protein Cas8c/Csd1 [Bacillota bacterium]NLN99235.1 type I-C CRISPR-associated protein Cas8c/Csd1 [Bacteroidales bacterium]